ncbi:MAG: helix-turn-helix domain-containing protein [Saprospiraceae bacterium]
MTEVEQIFHPTEKGLAKHIEYFWQVQNVNELFNDTTSMYSYPGITPELVIPIEGYFQYLYDGKTYKVTHPIISTVVSKNGLLEFNGLKSFVVVRFKSYALASLLPFVSHSSQDLITQPLINASEVFGNDIYQLQNQLVTTPNNQFFEILNDWFFKKLNPKKEGFLVDILNQYKIGSIKELMTLTNYSYSTLERLFKKETGLTPKKYFIFKRFKMSLEDIIKSEHQDWFDYISKYGYYDQSHFIKEVKKFTQHTPLQILNLPSFSSYRPR